MFFFECYFGPSQLPLFQGKDTCDSERNGARRSHAVSFGNMVKILINRIRGLWAWRWRPEAAWLSGRTKGVSMWITASEPEGDL